MTRNTFQSDLRSSKMAGMGDFVKIKLNKKLYDVFVYDLACQLHLIIAQDLLCCNSFNISSSPYG